MSCSPVLGGMKCPECEFVYGTKWELTRHLKTKHNLKVVEGNWEVAGIPIHKKNKITTTNISVCLSIHPSVQHDSI